MIVKEREVIDFGGCHRNVNRGRDRDRDRDKDMNTSGNHWGNVDGIPILSGRNVRKNLFNF